MIHDLEELEIKLSLLEIKNMSNNQFTGLIKRKIKERAFQYLVGVKLTRNAEGIEISHEKLEMQNYLRSEDKGINNQDRKLIFTLRTRMHFNTKTHFRNMHLDSLCDGCRTHESITKHTQECPSLSGGNELVT